MNRWKKLDRKILPPSRSDGSVAQKPQKHNPLPLDKTAFSGGVRERFWGKVIKSGSEDCWPWTAALTHDGYGRFGWGGTTHISHRIAFRMEVGEIPEGLCACHSCDNRKCCNPNHIWLGTHWDNVLDKMAKGRYKEGAKKRGPEWIANRPRGDDHPFRKNPRLPCFGEGVNTAKLDSSDVIKIRKFYATGKYGMKSLAMRFGVSAWNIKYIVDGKTWKHLL